MPPQHARRSPRLGAPILARYFLGSYVAVAIATCPFLLNSWRTGAFAGFYSASVFLSYSAFYLLPAVLVTGSAYLLSRAFRSSGKARKSLTVAAYGCALVLVTLVDFALVVDAIVMREFGFHLNGFVFNLVTTPGGIESIGLGETLGRTCSLVIFGLFCLQCAIFWAAQRPGIEQGRLGPKAYVYLVPALLLVSAGEHLTYILGDARSDSEILAQANAFPLYRASTARKFLRKWGLEVGRDDDLQRVEGDASPLDYPRHAIELAPTTQPFNVVWLVGESLRSDALTPEIMPATYGLSNRAWSFQRHYSGGNGTRMGVFSMFYGLTGPYWFSFLDERRGPVLIDVLKDENYQMHVSTSARFSYPEFDRTVFARLANQDLHDSAYDYYSESLDKGWKNDRKHTGEIVDFLKTRDRSRPFFVYMFFESTHYRYYFPEEEAVREPYLKDMKYAALGGGDPQLLHNRYLNAAHHLDTQIARILAGLVEAGNLEDTIVIITGDHGEEFMEKGRRGHNSEFHDEQVHVPLVLWVPGDSPHRVDSLTSHVDIAPTLLPLLGVKNPPQDYSLGHDLRGGEDRDYVVIADWSRIAILDRDYKLTIPVGGSGILEKTQLTTHDDVAIGDVARAFGVVRPKLAQVMSGLNRFRTGFIPPGGAEALREVGCSTPQDGNR